MIDDLIYDVGMNNGNDTAYYLHCGFRVLAIEADPTLCSQASARFKKAIEDGQLTILNVGITPQAGTFDFWICKTNSDWNSFDRSIASCNGSPHYSIQIPGQPFTKILGDYGIPYYLKVDIEGNDYLCIEALNAGRELPQYVSVELGDIYDSVQKLEALGYTGYKCINQYNFLPLQMTPLAETKRVERWYRLLQSRSIFARTICKFYGRDNIWNNLIRKIPRQQEWTFHEGCSGPFGEDTLGQWLSAEEVRKTYHYYCQRHQERQSSPSWLYQKYASWMDLHAKREI